MHPLLKKLKNRMLRALQSRPFPITSPENKALFTVQVGGYLTKAYADAKLEKLKELGYPADIVEVTDEKQQLWHLVCFGRFRAFAEAVDAMDAFKTKEKMPAVVIRPKSW